MNKMMTEELVYSELAQEIVDQLFADLRDSADLDSAVNQFLNGLAVGLRADRALIWQTVDTQLTVTHQYCTKSSNVVGTRLGLEESTIILLNLAIDSPGPASSGVIELDSESLAAGEWKPVIRPSDKISSSLLVSLRARGMMMGFLSLHSTKRRMWSDLDKFTLEKVTDYLSVILSYEIQARHSA